MAPKMTNTKHNDQPAASQPSSEGQPPTAGYQQDLIRLLAQHFNNQFYQMTNNQRHPDINPSAQLLHNFSNNATGGPLNFQSPLALSQYQQQQQRQQFRVGQAPVNYGGSPSSLILNLDQTTGLQPNLASQLPRSHQQSSTSGPSPLHQPHGQQHHTNALTMPNPNRNPLACNPLFGDGSLNLFNALNCFNVTSDQFLLSLQQQYLLQAASQVRQMESRQMGNNLNNEETDRISGANSHDNASRLVTDAPDPAAGDTRSINGVTDLSGDNNNGRELLKFSINTILGRGSPAAANDIKTDPAGVGVYRVARENELTVMGTPDCDQELNTTDIDSCSSMATTPQPGVASQTHNSLGQRAGHPSASSSMSNAQRPLSGGDLAMDINQQHSSGHHQATLSFLSGSSAFPWTVAARGKPRRGMMRRAVFSDSQRVGLEKRFQLQKYISKPDRKKLAEKLGLRDSQVKIWFQNRRMKWRNSKERELLSAGGSREQTLPTRNNPNPDLSDVGETIKRIVSGSNSIGAA